MSFFNTKPWAKIPTDLLENKAMQHVCKDVSPENRAAPILFYIAGATKADDNGIFDIGDCVEFASLIKVEGPEQVWKIAELMVRMRILAFLPKSSLFLFAEWEYPTNCTNKLNLQQRYKAAESIWKNKLTEKSFFNLQYKKVDTLANSEGGEKCQVNFATNGQNVLLKPQNVNSEAENVEGNRIEEIREDKTRADYTRAEQNTHTRVEGAGEEKPAAFESVEDSPAAGREKTSEPEKMEQEPERLVTVPDWQIVSENQVEDSNNLQESEERTDAQSVPSFSVNREEKMGEVCSILRSFFVNNNPMYNERLGEKTLKGIAKRIMELDRVPGDKATLARRLVFAFRQMHDEPPPKNSNDYDWSGIALFPQKMAKDGVFKELLNRVLKVYESEERELLSRKREEEERQVWQEEAYDPDEYYRELGIDPKAPDRAVQALLKKAAHG